MHDVSIKLNTYPRVPFIGCSAETRGDAPRKGDKGDERLVGLGREISGYEIG